MICIIPARKGSKRIPGKNFRAFCGGRIIDYPIAVAQESRLFREIIVATDWDAFLAHNVTRYNRRAENATGEAELEDVLSEVLDIFPCETCCLMLPTAVFVTANMLIQAVHLLRDVKIVFPVVRFEYPPQREMRRIAGNGSAYFVNPSAASANSQDLDPRYHDAGLFYMMWTVAFRDAWAWRKRLLEMENHTIEIPRTQCHDIDTEEDWEIAEMKWRAMQ